MEFNNISKENQCYADVGWQDKISADPLGDLLHLMSKLDTSEIFISEWALRELSTTSQCINIFGGFFRYLSNEEIIHYLNKYFAAPWVTKGIYEAKPIIFSSELPDKTVVMANNISVKVGVEKFW